MKVEFYKHNLDIKDIQNVVDVLKSTFLTTGNVVSDFESQFAEFMQAKHCITTSSCTSALHLSLIAAGVTKDDEVITTPLSFIATANAIEYVGAKPVFVDVERDTGNIDASLISNKVTKRTKAIIPVHLYGQLCDMKSISQIAKKHNLVVIEDAAHAVESSRENYVAGQYSDLSCFSFYATKNLTSGEGGAITTNNPKYVTPLKKLRLHGMSTTAIDRYSKKYSHYDMDVLGWKYNMTNVQAAMMVSQLTQLRARLEKREKIAQRYESAFSKIKEIELIKVLPNSNSARHLFTILTKDRDATLHKLQQRNIGVAVNFNPIHLMTYYKKKYGYKLRDFPNAEYIGAKTITLPLYPKLTKIEQDYVIKSVIEDVVI